MVKTINISQFEEGMILGDDIVNKFGQVLLGKGVSLTSKHINFFKVWNIEFFNIQTDEEESESHNHTPEEIENAKEALLSRMVWSPRNFIEEELIELGINAELTKLKL